MLKKIGTAGIYAIQIVLIIGLGVLNYLGQTKAGVAHHLIAKQMYFKNGLLNNTNMTLLKGLALFYIVVLVMSIIKDLKFNGDKKANKRLMLEKFIAVIVSLMLVIETTNLKFQESSIYPYVIFVTAIVVVLQLLKIQLLLKEEEEKAETINKATNKKNNSNKKKKKKKKRK